MADDNDSGGGGGGWISKYGIPSILASIVVFAFQQQQQTFDRLQANVQSGYQFYSSNRTQLETHDDADKEIALLKIIGRAFPNIYCDVREDLYERVLAAQDAGSGGKVNSGGIDDSDLDYLRSSIMADELQHPKVRPLPTNLFEALTPHFGKNTPGNCDALNQASGAPSVASTPAGTSAAVTPPPPVSAPTSSGATTTAPPSSAASAPTTSPSLASNAGPSAAVARGEMAQDTLRSSLRNAVRAALPALSPTGAPMRVFFHIPAGGRRDTGTWDFANQARVGLAQFNYRVMRGVERVNPGDVPTSPEIRYFGPDEQPAAQQLANYLNWQFASEGSQFHITAIGNRFPNMPHENLEVWLPDPHS
ncbi:MAG: hypothetical protein ABUL73_02665 [Alphaproteobacteria bacterium]